VWYSCWFTYIHGVNDVLWLDCLPASVAADVVRLIGNLGEEVHAERDEEVFGIVGHLFALGELLLDQGFDSGWRKRKK